MPKILVLFQSPRSDVVHLAEAAAEGARSVRFAEVDVRRLTTADAASDVTNGAGGRAHRPLGHLDEIGAYDGLILAADQEADAGSVLRTALDTFGGSLANKVGAVLTPATGTDRRTVLWSVLGRLADREMILVPAPFADEGAAAGEAARRVGKRVAEVVSWVTHAQSHHQHEHTHHH
jgi:NAD(P)H dehydrogenase (quinone)